MPEYDYCYHCHRLTGSVLVKGAYHCGRCGKAAPPPMGDAVRRSNIENTRIENTEDILASLARIVRQTEGCEKANDYMELQLMDIRRHGAELQQQVIAVTGYEYGRERVVA